MTVSFQNGSFFGSNASANALTPYGGITAADLYDEKYLDRRYNYQDTKESYEISDAGEDAAISSKISKINTYLSKGYEDKASVAYQELLQEISSQDRYSLIAQNETQLKAVARQMIESQTGENLEDLIIKNTDSSFERGFHWINNFNGDKLQEEDLLSEMCDIDTHTQYDGLANAGGAVCKVGTVVGPAVVGGIVAGPVGAIVGAVGGLIAAFIF